jgi:hypothetical protein
MIGDDGMVGKCYGQSLHKDQAAEQERVVRHMKLAGVKFRENVVYIQNNGRSQEFGHDCGKHQKIWNRMYVDELVFLREVTARDEGCGE